MAENNSDNAAAGNGRKSRSPSPGASQATSTPTLASTPASPISSVTTATEDSRPAQAAPIPRTRALANMSSPPLNPRPYLQARVGTEVVVRLKWGQSEYKGILQSVDSYMNVLLRDTVEFLDGQETGTLGLVLIRCNNILWIGDASTVQMINLGLH